MEKLYQSTVPPEMNFIFNLIQRLIPFTKIFTHWKRRKNKASTSPDNFHGGGSESVWKMKIRLLSLEGTTASDSAV